MSTQSKRDLYKMLGDAVLNTGGVPVHKPAAPPVIAANPRLATRLEPLVTAAPAPSSRPTTERQAIPQVSQVATSNDAANCDMPTADEVARAIVAAARETGDDPILIAEGFTAKRGRHYAMHALRHAFPNLSRESAARLVGCSGKPIYFWNNSLTQVAHIFTDSERATLKTIKAPDRTRAAKWWNEDAFDRVIKAIRA